MTGKMGDFKYTALFEEHVRLGAKTAPFAGWNMPINYPSGILAEHKHTRESVSLFDICHMGEFRFFGPDAADELDKVFARSVADQQIGVCRYNFLLNDQGGVVDDLLVYRMEKDDFFVVVNAGNIAADFDRIVALLPKTMTSENWSDEIGKLDLQGPRSAGALADLGVDKRELPAFYHCKSMDIGGERFLVSRTGYTGELGFELYGSLENIKSLWSALLELDEVEPAGLGARDTLRLESGLPLYGHELTEDTTPVEAGYGKLLKLEENPDRVFAGRDAMIARGVKKRLYGVNVSGRRAARAGAKVFAGGEEAGQVASGVFAPTLGHAIATVYIRADVPLAEGDKLELEVSPSARVEGAVTALPFHRSESLRAKI